MILEGLLMLLGVFMAFLYIYTMLISTNAAPAQGYTLFEHAYVCVFEQFSHFCFDFLTEMPYPCLVFHQKWIHGI